MYPGFIAEYEDRSAISSLAITEVRNKPLFCTVFTSDKGTEEWARVSGKDFFNMYGNNISFARHGQPLLQAAMAINSGAELLCKRLVASDAALANIGIVARIVEETVQATDPNTGNPLYVGADGNQTTEVTDTPYMTIRNNISYSIKSAEGAKTIEEAANAIRNSCSKADVIISGEFTVDTLPADAEVGSYARVGDVWYLKGESEWAETATVPNVSSDYLLYVISDNGRGTSKKRIKIVPNYKVSKTLGYTQYTLSVMEGDAEIESIAFSVNPSLIVNGVNISLQSRISTKSTQLKCIEYVEEMNSLVEAIAAASGVSTDDMYSYDVLFGCTNRGEALDGVSVDADSINLQYSYGQMLSNGSNGKFGSYPFSQTEEYSARAVEAFNGTFDTVIFNVDQYKINAIIDANYPVKVKRAIEALAMFREDFMYFRDQGLGMNNLSLIEEECKKNEAKSKFCSTYCQSYDVIDPYTKRQITVTIGYDIAQNLVGHSNILPTAGMKYGMTIKNAIYGTLSFSPVICPDVNQKEVLEDLRVNYASYIDNALVIESLYTSQEKYSQWSFVNNVMGIQEVVKAIRSRCPAIRYTFIEGEDLAAYKAEVEEVIAPYRSNFATLTFDYVADATYSMNKIFYAVLYVAYKDFIQTEMVKVVALSTASIEA